MPETVAVFIPIILFIVIGLVISLALVLKSKEKQLMLEKGLSPEQIMEFYKTKEKDSKNRNYLLKSGIILVCLVLFGIVGSMLDRSYYNDYHDPVYGVWLSFLGLGIGAIAAHFIARKFEITDTK